MIEDLRLRYLELLKITLLDLHRSGAEEYRPAFTGRKINYLVRPLMNLFQWMDKRRFEICERFSFDPEIRKKGKDWPLYGETMIGYKRLSNLQHCVTQVLEKNIEGDLAETGVWRGGAVIFMRAILKAYEVTNRQVWAADSFEGLPRPNAEKYSADKDDKFYMYDQLKVSLEQVKENFRKYDLLDDKVRFLKGWFRDTLPTAPIEKLAILRLDGDMYESTMDALVNLYPKLNSGGFLIVDDWGSVKGCRLAIEDYRRQHNVMEEIQSIDEDGVYWQKK